MNELWAYGKQGVVIIKFSWLQFLPTLSKNANRPLTLYIQFRQTLQYSGNYFGSWYRQDVFYIKIVSEYDQEISQSQIEDQPIAPRGRATHNHETPGRHTKQSNQLSLPYQDDCKTKKGIK